MGTPDDALRCSRCHTFHSDTVNCPPAPARAHTPLPWAMVYGTDGHHHIFAGDGPIADVKVRADGDEQEANANLLLAAPTLLAACKVARDHAGPVTWGVLNDAIKKAEGTS